MWTADNRPRYNRDKLRYPSDLTDAEWAHIEPLIPPGKPGGGKRRVAIREVINGVMYILSTGCQWRALPKDLPPRSTVHDYLGLWNWDGTLDRIHHALYLKCREKAAREASPTACIIDSQSVKSAEKGGLASTATASMPASVGVSLVGRSVWPGPCLRPDPRAAVLLSQSGLVLEPDLDPSGLGQSAYVGRQRTGKVFLNASMTRASCLGCCGRPLMCEKDSAASRSEMVRSL